jgi:hypothetical protein
MSSHCHEYNSTHHVAKLYLYATPVDLNTLSNTRNLMERYTKSPGKQLRTLKWNIIRGPEDVGNMFP